MTARFTCPMCGSTFDQSAHTGCASCPLNGGCTLVCCPVCGYQTVDTGRSNLARLAAGLLSKIESLAHEHRKVEEGQP